MITLQFIKSSFLRLQPESINSLPPTTYAKVNQGVLVGVKAYKPDVGLFLKVTFDCAIEGRNTWLVYSPDIKIQGTEPTNKPSDTNLGRKTIGMLIKLPGNSSKFYGNQPIISGDISHGERQPTAAQGKWKMWK